VCTIIVAWGFVLSGGRLYIVCMFDELRLRQLQRSVVLLDSYTSTLASLSRCVEVCVAQSLLPDFLRHLEFVTSSMVSGISSCTLHLSEARSGIVGLVVSVSGLFPMSKCLVDGQDGLWFLLATICPYYIPGFSWVASGSLDISLDGMGSMHAFSLRCVHLRQAGHEACVSKVRVWLASGAASLGFRMEQLQLARCSYISKQPPAYSWTYDYGYVSCTVQESVAARCTCLSRRAAAW
jgi:hypothetical protein